MPRPVAARTTLRPTAVEPVKETTSLTSIRAAPSCAPPGSREKTSAGSASASSPASLAAQAVASGAGLSSTQLPVARAGAAFHSGMASGKFQGVISPATPCGWRRV